MLTGRENDNNSTWLAVAPLSAPSRFIHSGGQLGGLI